MPEIQKRNQKKAALAAEGMDEAEIYEEMKAEERSRWEDISVPDHMEFYLKQGMEKKEAMKQVAKDRGVSKRDIYGILLQES